MRYGRTLPDGFLPIFSVGSEEEAKNLLVMTCETNLAGEYIARELATEQSMENLIEFGRRLETIHRLFFQFHEGRCDCDLGIVGAFQVGERVRIFQLLDSMTSRSLIGMVGTIEEVDLLPNGHFNYYVRSAGQVHYMHEEELEKEEADAENGIWTTTESP